VEEQVVMSAEEDSGGDIGAAAIPFPVLDVVGFAPGGWALTAGEAASTVAGSQCDALAGAEEAAFAAEIQRLAGLAERQRRDRP